MTNDASPLVRARERRGAGDFRGALEDLQALLEADPRSVEALCERGLTRIAAASPGWRVWKTTASLTGLFETYDARIEALSCTREEAIRGAMADYSKCIELDPAQAGAWWGRARLRKAIGHPDAWTDYARAVQLLPADAAILIERSGQRLNVRNIREALEDAEAAVALAPLNAEAWTARGRVRLAKRELPGARKDFDRALELDPGQLPALWGRARSRAVDDPPGAKEDLARAAALTPARSCDFYHRGLAAGALGDAKQAAEDFTSAIDGTPVWSPERVDLEVRLKETLKVPLHRSMIAAPVTTVLLALCVAVMVVAEQAGSTTESDILVRFGATEREHVWSGQYWRLLTSMFLHIGWVHLAWNVWAMFGWCTEVERILGHGRFLAAYLLTGLASSALSLVGHPVVSAGASGAGFGMIGILLGGAFLKLGGATPFFIHRGVVAILKWVFVWFVLGFTVMPMDNWGHLGGFLSGIAAGGLWVGGPRISRIARAAAWALFSAVLAALVLAAIHPWPFLYSDGMR
ncbi:MAG: rhomboid family intramembrane serine protease [Planctomycetes bacterium]|nr:rhomboid family intramembrane serine protease [Planctomycetota bacterium]